MGGLIGDLAGDLAGDPEGRRVVRVVIVDDDALVRSALTLMLGGQDDLEVVGEAADGRAGVRLVEELAPSVVLMDIRMPVLNGLEATRELSALPTPPQVVVLTTFDADDLVLEALAAGAQGFLLKDTPPEQIVAAVRLVAAGEAMLSPSVTRTLIDRLRTDRAAEAEPREEDRRAAARRRLGRLTERELEVARVVGRGHSNAEVARELYLSVPTVKAHVSRLLDKLEATNRVQVALLVHDAGDPGPPGPPSGAPQSS